MVISRVRLLIVSLLAVVAVVAPLGGTATAAPVAAPSRFSTAELVGPYPSDIPPGGTYIPLLDGFADLRAHRPLSLIHISEPRRPY